MSDIPVNEEEYITWARDKNLIPVDINVFIQNYKRNVQLLKSYLQKTQFYMKLEEILTTINTSYKSINGSPVFRPEIPELQEKPFESVLNKMFRMDCLENIASGKLEAEKCCNIKNIYERLNDILRCTISTNYVDGPPYVASELTAILENEYGITINSKSHEKESGYYAKHVYIPFKATLVDISWQQFEITAWYEIQICTVMQTLLKELTHGAYEDRRMGMIPETHWKWSFDTFEFNSSYIGHTMHLIDSLILNLRNETKEKCNGK